MDIHEPVVVYTLTNQIEAEILKNYLHAEGIACFLDGANQASQMNVSAFEIKILVDAGHADRARKLIASHDLHKNQ